MNKEESVHEIINRIPELQSCLYDLNLLPEVLVTFGQGQGTKEYFYMLSIVDHFIAIEKRLSK